RGVVTVAARASTLTAADCRDLFGTAAPGPCVEVTVTDTGTGIAPEVARRLFRDLFYTTRKRKRGMGLAVVYGILQAFGGGLRLGPGPGQGTAVRLYLPRTAPANGAAL